MPRTGFVPSRHGFPFANCFPPGCPVVAVPTPFGRINLGDVSGGLCGGMAFAALDLFLHGNPCPADPTTALVQYLRRRLLDSWNLPFGVLKYYDWQRRPAASRSWSGVRVLDGLTRLTVEDEWPRVRASLDAGQPAPLGVVHAHSFNPWQLPRNHQVLAYDYAVTGDELAVAVYDPNWPGADDLWLRVSLCDPDEGRPVVHDIEGPTVRGFFLSEYHKPAGPPAFDLVI